MTTEAPCTAIGLADSDWVDVLAALSVADRRPDLRRLIATRLADKETPVMPRGLRVAWCYPCGRNRQFIGGRCSMEAWHLSPCSVCGERPTPGGRPCSACAEGAA